MTVAGILLLALAWLRKGTLPTVDQILPELQQAPTQTPTERLPFSFAYRGQTYEVTPKAEYEMWGLVVSHNNIAAFTDIYHDADSVDIKDLCTVWGTNLQGNDFRRVEYKSDCYVCRFRYPRGVKFNHFELANTHVICSDPVIREQITGIHIGDQIGLRGLLVNYRWSNTDWERKSSLTRNDKGMGACEVMFVEEVDILQPGTPVWYQTYDLVCWILTGLILTKLGLFIIKGIRDQRDYQRRIRESS